MQRLAPHRQPALTPVFFSTTMNAVSSIIMSLVALLAAPVSAAGVLRGGHSSRHVAAGTAPLPAVSVRAGLVRRRRLLEQDAVKWVVHRNENAEVTHVTQGEAPTMNPACPVTCMAKVYNGLDLLDVKPGEKRIDAVHVFHSSSATKPCHEQKLQHHFTGLTIRAYGWHVHTSNCAPKASGAKAPLMTHKCTHDIATAKCTCTCNYAN